jgi:hypothetical protein
MTKRHEATGDIPMDVRALWGMNNGSSLEFAEKAYRAWLNGAGRIQNETIGFLNGRIEKNLAAARELTSCKTATEYFDVQAKYADAAVSDWIAQSQKMAQLLNELTIETTQPLNEAGETTRRGGRG